jgi:hypothetical protein
VQILITIEPLPQGDGWSVQAFKDGARVEHSQRYLRRIAASPLPFPQPPQAESEAIPSGELHRDLCTTLDGRKLADTYAELLDRINTDKAVERFGRYLFTCLLGESLWTQLYQLAGDEPMELAIAYAPPQAGSTRERNAIERLPWEMMHSADGFLATKPDVAITRRVIGCPQNARELKSLPKVLFVVGSGLDDSVIRPGAEYLGLIRSLSSSGLDVSLIAHLQLMATPQTLKQAVEWFQPDVIHFICHAGCDQKGCFLYLLDEDAPHAPKECYAPSLIQLLGLGAGKMEASRLQVVVLNACSTAQPSIEFGEVGQISSPLAAELIRAGVPAVVGMAGEVSDQACRLFTRGFYSALLGQKDLEYATAQGRRAGIIGQGVSHPASSLDWSLPTVFLADGMSVTHLAIPPEAIRVARARDKIAREFAPLDSYPIFCGRLGVFESYNLLVAPPETQRTTSPGKQEFSMLALPASEADKADKTRNDERFGRTWLLHELAGQMVRDGHIPCLVTADNIGVDELLKTPLGLLRDIINAALRTATIFKIDGWTAQNLLTLADWQPKTAAPATLPEEIRSYLAGVATVPDPNSQAMALRYDLLNLRQMILKQIASGGAEEKGLEASSKLILLIDDAHRLDTATTFLVTNLLGPSGLRGAAAQIRVVVTYAAVANDGQLDSVKKLIQWQGKNWVHIQKLDRWKSPEDILMYKSFLLHWQMENLKTGARKPLALRTDADAAILQLFFDEMQKVVRGYPSRLPSPDVCEKIHFFLNALPSARKELEIFREANDEDALSSLAKLGRGQR